ncbi:hypothetical protein V8E54_008641 [Elaphomyces granulatus]
MDLRRSMLSPQAKGSERTPVVGTCIGSFGEEGKARVVRSEQTDLLRPASWFFTGQLLVLHPPEYYFTYYSTPLAARPPRSARGRDPPTRRPAHPPLSKVKVIFHLYMILLLTVDNANNSNIANNGNNNNNNNNNTNTNKSQHRHDQRHHHHHHHHHH